MSDMHEDDPKKVWELSKRIGTAMFVTRDGDGLEGRPLQAYPEEDAGVIYFMTDISSIRFRRTTVPAELCAYGRQ